MARCFACDITVQDGYDRKTDRYYCFTCFEPTNKVILSNLEAEDNEFPWVNSYTLEDWVTTCGSGFSDTPEVKFYKEPMDDEE